MDNLLNHAAALELAARDILLPVCGFGAAWCVIGLEAVALLLVFGVTAMACWVGGRSPRLAVALLIAIWLAVAALIGGWVDNVTAAVLIVAATTWLLVRRARHRRR